MTTTIHPQIAAEADSLLETAGLAPDAAAPVQRATAYRLAAPRVDHRRSPNSAATIAAARIYAEASA